MCLRRAPEKYIAGAKAGLDRAAVEETTPYNSYKNALVSKR
jgi:hypothetical protein